ncbi:sensor protein ChvG [Luteitalea sp. TBR-22]|uniref:sensor histidine kinase n=1 Tax=Luteitalea sp. TBR-22 TaxID=2802971 RepID=UPI001AF3A9CA|nr:stimulus-sensing domain-containing protein [Luteitalea sp. TBR-22]BCS35386.1 sensor protein ChvG [Luteitalea sp. TBR-22]
MDTPGSGRELRTHRTLRARLSRIGIRLLLFNVLAVVMPVAGILYLDVYEQELLHEQERAMVQEARLVAGALGGGATLDEAGARALLARTIPGDTRVRVYDRMGRLVADSARLAARVEPARTASYDAVVPTRDFWLYRLGAWLAGLRQRAGAWLRDIASPRPPAGASAGNGADGRLPEVDAALAGRYGAATRPTPGQRSLTLTVALPVLGAIGAEAPATRVGAVTVSQSTFRVLQALYAVRLHIFRIVVGTLGLSALLSALLTWTIVRPIRRLRRSALSLARGERAMSTTFPGTERRDEVGDLARALEELTRRLQSHVALLEAFAGDVAHEVRNPLASIRTAVDVLAQSTDPDERARFAQLLARDVERLDRLVVGMRDLARVDSAIEREAVRPVSVSGLVSEFVRHRAPAQALVLDVGPGDALVRAQPERVAQVVENLVDNAIAFSPAPGSVVIGVREDGGAVVLTVGDRGPGIPEEHRDRVFERFFSYRPGANTGRHEHAGLGLAIVKAIVDAYGGSITTRARDGGGGALFEVRLPRA